MAIEVTIDDLNIPESLKTDEGVIAEVNIIIGDVKRLALMEMDFTEDDLEGQALDDFQRIVRMECEFRFYLRNQPGNQQPQFGHFYSSDAFSLWRQYYNPFVRSVISDD